MKMKIRVLPIDDKLLSVSHEMIKVFSMHSLWKQSNNLAITRDNSILMDGAGSQLQRNYCTYALARFLQIGYVHSPLKEMSYPGLVALEKKEDHATLIKRYNETFNIPSDLTLPQDAIIHSIEKIELSSFQTLQTTVCQDSRFHLIKAGFPYLISDCYPQMLECLKQVSPFESPPSSLFRIAIHVRRGELFVVDSHRMLPNSYYITVIQNITKILDRLAIPFICELHTELPINPLVVTLDHHEPHQRRKELAIITSEMSNIEDFNTIPHLKKCINQDPIKALQAMATADLLVISRSSFSYLAGLLNKRGCIIYHPFWHNAPPAWLNVHEQGALEQKFHEHCRQWQNQ